ncbi:hypothetical protein CK203_085348 [Vitis vinifera]|uniref:Uncharacterized protein n=1 Tax=Vitis vinifera TaxID=29760 RepID=A0A438DCU8_VITVI|nr:hypothetical protein CK203_085348 [Vitis vinifera]
METLSRVGCLTNCTHFPFPTSSPIYPPQSHSTRLPSLSVLRTPRPVGELAGEDVLRMFFKERELNGDFISKASDMLWQREVMKFVDAEAGTPPDTPQQPEGVKETEYEGGFLKLTRTQEWVLGDNSAPINKKAIAKVLQDDSERRKRLNLLKYEAQEQTRSLLRLKNPPLSLMVTQNWFWFSKASHQHCSLDGCLQLTSCHHPPQSTVTKSLFYLKPCCLSTLITNCMYCPWPIAKPIHVSASICLTAWATANADLCLSSLSFLALLPMPIIDCSASSNFLTLGPWIRLPCFAPMRPVVTGPCLAHGQCKKMLMWKCLYNNYLAIFCIGIHARIAITYIKGNADLLSFLLQLKREILLLSVGIGTACSGQLLVMQQEFFSAVNSQTDGHFVNLINISLFLPFANRGCRTVCSCLYLQLLYQHADNLSKEAVPQIFMKKKSKKIGIRSQDLEDLLEKTIKGSGIALSSPS